jgi:hypothetical protein
MVGRHNALAGLAYDYLGGRWHYRLLALPACALFKRTNEYSTDFERPIGETTQQRWPPSVLIRGAFGQPEKLR